MAKIELISESELVEGGFHTSCEFNSSSVGITKDDKRELKSVLMEMAHLLINLRDFAAKGTLSLAITPESYTFNGTLEAYLAPEIAGMRQQFALIERLAQVLSGKIKIGQSMLFCIVMTFEECDLVSFDDDDYTEPEIEVTSHTVH